MRDISSSAAFFSIAAGFSLLVGASFMHIPPPAKHALAYDKCVELHPQRYCAITYMGAK
jgi:hypothetical protein